ENRPYGAIGLESPMLLYPKGHPYDHSTIGSREDIKEATVSDVVSFFSDYYFPANASLVIAGDFDSKQARAWVDQYFGKLTSKPQVKRVIPELPKIAGPVRKTLEDKVELPLLRMIWRSPKFYAEGDAEMDLLASVIGGGKSSRLYRKLVYDKKTAQSVSAYQYSGLLASEFIIEVYARPGADLAEIEDDVTKELASIRLTGITRRELERARNGIETSFWHEVEGLADRADLLNRYEFYLGNPGAIGIDLARYRDATVRSATKYALRVFDPKARVILTVLPKKENPPKTEAAGKTEANEGGES
ncbi:MAG: insulinase family protein, partial [Planctomycetota bacterium]